MGNKRTVKNTYFDESRMLIYDLNALCNALLAVNSTLSPMATAH
jgi:hypothetical protein